MSLVPALDLRPANRDVHPNDPAAVARIPSNIEAEQALIGVVLYDNEAFHQIQGLEARHFYEPFHQELWEWIATSLGTGKMADPVMAGRFFERSEALTEFGGIRYLADLVDRAGPATGAPSYAAEIVDMALRRDLIRLAGEVGEGASEA
ncbi:MAG TPA: DnaB-like helicase N-terminal domain-containing protein, partial [Phenylobacterium sp.]|nr:DnaB-like helicase N-terminal domain-containing protein [Phenylobacterium sp.]